MRVSLKSVFAGLTLGVIASSASAAIVNATSTVAESGFVGPQVVPVLPISLPAGVAPNPLLDANSYPLTKDASPYSFAGQVNSLANVTSIDSLTITLQISDGDTGPTDYDFNNLFLSLDGINTGLALNDFFNNQNFSQTLTQLAPTLQAQLIAALQDGQLVGRVLDTSPANAPVGDTIAFPALVDTTLDLVLSGPNLAPPGNGGGGNPVPLPAAVVLAPIGAGLAGMYSRRFRRTK